MCPSWDPAIPQVMQQHGGRNRYPVTDLSKAVADPAVPDEPPPRATSLQVYPQTAPVPPVAGSRQK